MHRTAVLSLALFSLAGAAHASDAVAAARAPSFVPWSLLPNAITSFGAEVEGGWLYVLGGYHGTPHDYSTEGQSRAFYRLSLRDARHVELLPFDEGVQSLTLEAHGGRILRVGGLAIDNPYGEPEALRSLDTVAFYDPVSAVWTDGPALPGPRSSHQSVVAGDTAYVVGGWNLQGGRNAVTWHDTWLSLDLAAPDAEWTSHPAPFQSRALGLAATPSHVVAVGGMDGVSGKVTSAVWMLDRASGEWSQGPEFPDSGFGASACSVGEHVLASGRNGDVHAWRPGEDAWRRVASHAFPRFFHELVSTPGGEVLALGGIAGMDPSGRLRHVERLRPMLDAPAGVTSDAAPDAPAPTTVSATTNGASADGAHGASAPTRVPGVLTRFSVPAPSLARNRQGMVLVDRNLYLFGGNRSTGQHDFGRDDFLSEGWKLSLADLSWHRLPDFPKQRQSMVGMPSPDGRELWFLGGFGFADDAAVADEARTQGEGWAYDLEFGIWRPLGGLPVPRSQFGLAWHEGTGYILGGLDFDPDLEGEERFRHLRPLLRVDVEDRMPHFAEAGIDLPEPRRAFGCAELGGLIYLVGGMQAGFEKVDECHVFDPSSGTFGTIASPRATRISPELLAIDGRLVLFGGTSTDAETGKSRSDASVEVYDPSTDRWQVVVDDVGIDSRQARAFALDGRLLIASFQAEDAGTATFVLVDI